MQSILLVKGFIIGFSIAAPVGPIGVLCIRRTFINGWRSGILSGLGAAFADTVYGIIAAFGLTFISSFLIEQQFLLRILVGIFLLVLGVKTFLTEHPWTDTDVPKSNLNLTGDCLSAFVLTLMNPLTIIAFAGIFAAIGLSSSEISYYSATIIVLGVFAGACFWWFILSCFVTLLKTKLKFASFKVMNRVSGSIIFVFGIVALEGAVRQVWPLICRYL